MPDSGSFVQPQSGVTVSATGLVRKCDDAVVLPAAARSGSQSLRRTALAGLIGNVMEWFDFAVYGYFASVIGGQFFSQSSAGAQLLLTFAVFGIGFLGRPIGSLV